MALNVVFLAVFHLIFTPFCRLSALPTVSNRIFCPLSGQCLPKTVQKLPPLAAICVRSGNASEAAKKLPMRLNTSQIVRGNSWFSAHTIDLFTASQSWAVGSLLPTSPQRAAECPPCLARPTQYGPVLQHYDFFTIFFSTFVAALLK
jgi:hypothetical protein